MASPYNSNYGGNQYSTANWPTEGTNTTTPGGTPGGGTGSGTGSFNWGSFGGGGSSSPGNFGQGMYPWLQPYGGNFTAPMSNYENNALGGYNSFVQGGMGLNPAGSYLGNELSGQYLNLNSNPYLQQIQQGEQGMKNYNDQQAMARIGSSMALGGNAMSGAKLGAQNDYMNQSNNQFEALMGQLMNQNYGMERGLQSQAPGQLANLANTAGQGYSQLFGMGALPRSLQQNDLNAQYQDFLRQSGGMQNAFQAPDQQMLQLLYGGGYKGQYQPQYGSSQLDQILGSLGGSGIDLSGLLGGIGTAVGGVLGTNTQSQDPWTQYQQDGIHMGYDAAPGTTGPANYYDQNWYQNALTQREAQRASQQNQGAPNTLPAALVTLLLSMLGGNKSQSNKSKTGVGIGGPGQSSTGANSAGSHPYSPGNSPTPTAASIYDQQIGPGLIGSPGGIPGINSDIPGQSLNDYLGYLTNVPQDPNIQQGGNLFTDQYGNPLSGAGDSGGGYTGDMGNIGGNDPGAAFAAGFDGWRMQP